MEMDRFDVDLQVCVVKEQGRKENQDMPKRYVEISELGFVYRCLFINSTDMSDCWWVLMSLKSPRFKPLLKSVVHIFMLSCKGFI